MSIRSFEDLKKETNVREIRPRVLPWANEVKRGYNTASSPSPLYCWYVEENAKRQKGLDNEIDRTDIKNAITGVKNIWSERVKKNIDLFKNNADVDKMDWETLKSL